MLAEIHTSSNTSNTGNAIGPGPEELTVIDYLALTEPDLNGVEPSDLSLCSTRAMEERSEKKPQNDGQTITVRVI